MKAVFCTSLILFALLLVPMSVLAEEAADEPVAAEAAPAEAAEPETELGKLAVSLKPGQMKELKTKNYNWDLMKSWHNFDKGEGLIPAAKNTSIISWSSDANWDPVTKQLFYYGLGHYAAPKFVRYSAVTNEWAELPMPTWSDKRVNARKAWPVGHSYDLMALSPKDRVYVLVWGRDINFFHIDDEKWSAAPLEGAAYGNRANKGNLPIEYFPEMNGFLYLGGRGNNLMLYNMKTKKSRKLGTVPFGAHGIMEYNPVHKVMLVGGGDGNLDRLSLVAADGKSTPVAQSPAPVRCTSESKATVCPVTGEFLIQGRGMKHMVAFHPIKNEWKALPRSAPNGMAAPIANYGVVMFCTAGRNPKVYIYKHKSPWAEEKAAGDAEAGADQKAIEEGDKQ